MSQRFFGYISQPNNVTAYAAPGQTNAVYANQGQNNVSASSTAPPGTVPTQYSMSAPYSTIQAAPQPQGGFSGQYATTPIVMAASAAKPTATFIAAPSAVAAPATHSGFIPATYENIYSATGAYHQQHSTQPQTTSYLTTQNLATSYVPVSCAASVITSSTSTNNTNYTNAYNNPAYHQQVASQSVMATANRPPAQSVQSSGNRAMEEALHAAAMNVLQTQVVAAGGSPAVVAATSVIRPNAYTAALAKGLSASAPRPSSSVRYGNPGLGYKKNSGAPRNRSNDSFFYCDVCKISCASALTYKDHLQGQKHKKREASQKASEIAAAASAAASAMATASSSTSDKSSMRSSRAVGGGHSIQYRCELCDITCTGLDAYQAHIRGKQHKKTERLHQSMGKPIPSQLPVVLGSANNSFSADISNRSFPLATVGVSPASVPNIPAASVAPYEEVNDPLAQPIGQEYVEEEVNPDGKLVNYYCKLCDCHFNDVSAKEMHLKGKRHRLQYKKKVDPTLKVDSRTLPPRERKEFQNLNEKLRRRKDNFLQRQALEQTQKELVHLEWATAAISSTPVGPQRGINPIRMMRPPGGPMRLLTPSPSQPNSGLQDKHVLAKHNSLSPTDQEIESSQGLVTACEEALKLVSLELNLDGDLCLSKENQFNKSIDNAAANVAGVVDSSTEEENNVKVEKQVLTNETDYIIMDPTQRALRGTNRVGLLVKHLLLHGDRLIQLVPIFANWPTRKVVRALANRLAYHLQNFGKDFTVELNEKTFSEITIKSNDAIGMECHILPTSLGTRQKTDYEKDTLDKVSGSATQSEVVVTPTVARTNVIDHNVKATVAVANPGGVSITSSVDDSNGGETENSFVLNDESSILVEQEYCLHALALLRQAKWFQSKVSSNRNCLIIIRLLRDLCQRVPTWNALAEWAMEILVERSINSLVTTLSPSSALRRVFECLAWGILLPGGQGLYDPCEKLITDAAGGLSPQQREDLTASAQHALRLIAFGQIHQVLDMEPLTMSSSIQAPVVTRKRRHSNVRTSSGGEGGADSDGEENYEEEHSLGMKQEIKKPAPSVDSSSVPDLLIKEETNDCLGGEEEEEELTNPSVDDSSVDNGHD